MAGRVQASGFATLLSLIKSSGQEQLKRGKPAGEDSGNMTYTVCARSRDTTQLRVCELWPQQALTLVTIVIVILISHGVDLCLVAVFARAFYEQVWRVERDGTA